jgi:hypothetical protein
MRDSDFTDWEGNPIVAIEYHKNGREKVPHSVWTERSVYDFEMADGYLCARDVGSGALKGERFSLDEFWFSDAPEATGWLWYDRDFFTGLRRNSSEEIKLTKKEAHAMGWRFLKEPLGNPFDGAIDSGTQYCAVCLQNYPDQMDMVCSHFFESDYHGEWLGCGAPDADLEGIKAGVFRLLDLLSVEALKIVRQVYEKGAVDEMLWDFPWRSLNGRFGKQWRAPGFGFDFSDLDREPKFEDWFEPAIAWLRTIWSKDERPLAITRGWMLEYFRARSFSYCLDSKIYIHETSKTQLDRWMALEVGQFEGLSKIPVSVNSLGRSVNATELKRGNSEKVLIKSRDGWDGDQQVLVSVGKLIMSSKGPLAIVPGRVLAVGRNRVVHDDLAETETGDSDS